MNKCFARCNKLVLNAPGCTHNCLADKQDLKLQNSLHKLLAKSRKLNTIADETLPVIGKQALQILEESSEQGEETSSRKISKSSTSKDELIAGNVDLVEEEEEETEQEERSPRRRVKEGGRRETMVLKQQLDKLMLGKKKRRAKFNV